MVNREKKIFTVLISVTFQSRALSSIGENGSECGRGRGEGFSGAKVNRKTLIDMSEPAICYEYWSEDSLMQQLLLKHLNVNVRCNNNVLAQLDNCIEGLLRLEPNVITYRTL